MTLQNEVLWHLRIYGPCDMATLVRSGRLPRDKVVSTMTRLRACCLAERTMRRRYRITAAGERQLRDLGTPLFAD